MRALLKNAVLFTTLISASVLQGAEPSGGNTSDHETEAASLLERGRYLVTIAGCNDCHTPLKPGPNGPEPDWSRMLSGHPETLVMPPSPVLPEGPWQIVSAGTATAHSGPWGVSFTANLTPDPETGLGKWTLKEFMDTIRTGRHQGRGREVLPPMPISVYKHMTDGDLEAVYTYLQSIPAITNKVPQPIVPDEEAFELASNRAAD